MAEQPPPGSRWRHLKRGTTYTVIDTGAIEATLDACVIYKADADGTTWVRPLAEFMDGRFSEISRKPCEEWRSAMTAEDVWALEVTVGDQQVLISELRAALRRAEILLTALTMGIAGKVNIDQVCDEGHLTSVLKDVRASLGVGK